ncbi:MAG TPA: formylmethanofuran dehydrogenase subunit C [Geminicoccaceae bacterium]|nr:formylmethanofuran dehydrogenase subunit C [Geminicoccus sp.]HMU52150.1 formylmethanofuran dehydrogenase subunit C [Geminicoccaceae bacterium]
MPTLTLRVAPQVPLDLSPLLPDAGITAATPLQLGNQVVRLGELFDLAPGRADELRLVGTDARCDRIGAGLDRGRIVVEGDAGALAGAGMTGGEIELRGSAGALAGCEMSGGVLRIDGDAGEALGGALPGAGGMSGGAILLAGGCGPRAAGRMRKGLIVIGGDAGPHAAWGMRGGTLIVHGACASEPAGSMKRGTLYLARAPERLLPTFTDDGAHELLWLGLLERHLRTLGAPALPSRKVRRWAGDVADLGKGELLVAA